MLGDVVVEFDQARLNVLRQDRGCGPRMGPNVHIFRCQIILQTVMINDDRDGNVGFGEDAHELAGGALVVDQDETFVEREVLGLDGLDGPALEGNACELDEGDVFLVTEGACVDDVRGDVEFLGNEFVGPGGGEGVGVREVLQDHDLTFAAMAFHGFAELVELLLLLGRSQHVVGRSGAVFLVVAVAVEAVGMGR